MATSANIEVTIGTILSDTYEIMRVLGEGGMGAVWEASHLRLPGKRCAVKVLHAQASADQEAYARFRREADIASRIGHPNIIEVLDWNTLPSGSPYLVLEYLDGEDLAARLARGPVPLAEALSIARQIGSALKAAHANQVVHRDLKPGNIFLVPREVDGVIVDHVKVLDFGISKIRNSQTVQTQDAVLLGTPQYMAPEQALGKNHEIDGRTDVFALAAIVYEMLSGRPAFLGASLAEVVFKVVYEPVTPLPQLVPDVPPTVAAAIEHAMQKSASDRYPDVSSFIEALTGRGLASTDRRGVTQGAPAIVAPTGERTSVDARTSNARGEVQPPASQQGGGKAWMFFAAAVVVGGLGAFGAVELTAKKPAAVKPQQVELHEPVGTKPVDTKPVDTKPADTKPTDTKLHVAKPHDALAAIPPEAATIIDAADAAFAAKDMQGAITLARRSMQYAQTSRAYALLTRAHCRNSDLTNARATWIHVGASDKPRVRKDCAASGIDL